VENCFLQTRIRNSRLVHGKRNVMFWVGWSILESNSPSGLLTTSRRLRPTSRTARDCERGDSSLHALVDAKQTCSSDTFASRLVMAGVGLRTVQELWGHKTIQMTCCYAHLGPQHRLAAVQRLCDTEKALSESASKNCHRSF